jgi:hypothetical protein
MQVVNAPGGIQFGSQLAAPSAADSGSSLLWMKRLSNTHGFALPYVLNQVSGEVPIMPGFGGGVQLSQAVDAGTTSAAPTAMGMVLTTVGTATKAQTLGGASRYLRIRKSRYPSAATAGAGAGIRTNYTHWARGGNGSEHGFFVDAIVGQNVNLNGGAYFAGLTSQVTALAGNPSSMTNCCGIGYDSGDSSAGNWYFMRNDGSGTATKVDIGTARATDQGFRLMMLMPPGSGTLYVRLLGIDSGSELLDTSYSSDVPAADIGLAWKHEAYNGAVASAVNIEFHSLMILQFQL